METTKCTLGAVPGKYRTCSQADCLTCGFEAAEIERRLEYINQNSLTLCPDGLRRLIINRAEDAAEQENAVTQQTRDVKEQV